MQRWENDSYTWQEHKHLLDTPEFTGGWVKDEYGNTFYGLTSVEVSTGGGQSTGSSGNGDIRMVFDRSDSELRFYDDGGTPNDTSDDVLLSSFAAHNNVTTRSQGIWSTGTYSFIDRSQAHCHGSSTDSSGILRDSSTGSYGENGIYRVEDFYDQNGNLRRGMGIHAGREHIPFGQNRAEGCIRTTPEAMQYLEQNLANGRVLTEITVQD